VPSAPRVACFVASLLCLPGAGAPAQDITAKLTNQIAKTRTALDAIPATEFVKGESANIRNQLTDAEKQVQEKRPLLAVETLAGACASAEGLAAAGDGWGKDGKGIDVLEKDWNTAGAALARDRKKFPARAPAGQPAFVRAIAEISIGQVQENYAAAFGYGREAGLEYGAYYIGRSQGHMAFALFSAALQTSVEGQPVTVPDLTAQIVALDKAIVAAYAKPGSTTFHSSFIVANASIKLARETNAQGYHAGALIALMRAHYALGQTQISAPPMEELSTLRSKAGEWAKKLAADKRDHSIPEQYLEKAQMAIAAGDTEGEAGANQRQRAALLLTVVLPQYYAIMEGAK